MTPKPITTSSLSIGYTSGRSAGTILSGLSLELNAGEFVALLGANGTGKSTLLRTLSGSQPPTGGEIMINGRPILSLSPRKLSLNVSMVYTDRTAAGGLTVSELVALGRQPYTGFFGRLSLEDKDKVNKAMEATGIRHKADAYVASLSDGERQKAFIARAVAQETQIIILDEPTAFLDVAARLDMMRLMSSLASEYGKSVLMSTHDLAPALTFAMRLWLIDPYRRTIIQGKTSDIIDSGQMDSLFPDRDMRFDTNRLDFITGTDIHK